MYAIKWSNTMSVGVLSLDDEHRRFVEMLNDLYKALQDDIAQDVITYLVDTLLNYAIVHFKHEEDLFTETAYADREAHKKEHRDALQYLMDFKSKIADGASLEHCHEMFDFLKQWFDDHVARSDKKYIDHMKAHGVA